ncbi:MAG: hypothetical protein WAM28_04890 [Chlamydiales bacterium]
MSISKLNIFFNAQKAQNAETTPAQQSKARRALNITVSLVALTALSVGIFALATMNLSGVALTAAATTTILGGSYLGYKTVSIISSRKKAASDETPGSLLIEYPVQHEKPAVEEKPLLIESPVQHEKPAVEEEEPLFIESPTVEEHVQAKDVKKPRNELRTFTAAAIVTGIVGLVGLAAYAGMTTYNSYVNLSNYLNNK